MLDLTKNDTHESLQSWQKRLSRTYIYAFGLILASILTGGIILHNALSEQAGDAETLNIAGAQRMLSQRIAALTYGLSDQPAAGVAEQLKMQLQQAIERMRGGHDYLTSPGPNGQSYSTSTHALTQLYHPDGGDLDGKVNRFLADAMYWLGDNANEKAQNAETLNLATFNVFSALLKDLDRAVSLYESKANQKLARARYLHNMGMMLVILVIGIEAIFVFWPMARKATSKLQTYENELAERSALLSHSMQIARLGYWYVCDPMPGKIWISEELSRLYRLETMGQAWTTVQRLRDLVYDQNSAAMADHAKTCRATGKQQSVQTRVQCEDGAILDIETLISPTINEAGEVVALTGVVRDVTEAMRARRLLETRTAHLSEAHKLGSVAMWRLRLGEKSFQLGPDTYALLRYETQANDGRDNIAETPLKSLCIGRSYEDILAAKQRMLETGEPQKIDIALRCGDGTIADIALRLKLETNELNEPVALFGTIQDVTEQRSAQRQLEQLAYYDHLTGLANRALCTRRLKKACEQAQSLHLTSALVLIDLDNFKEINDGLGHQAGDEFLCEVGRRLAQIAGPNNVCARLGGDEFAVIVTRVGDLLELDVMVSKMLAAITMPVNLVAGEASGSGSAGICIIPSDTAAYDEALQFADLALYDAKNSGRNQSSFFDASMSKEMQTRLSLSRDLKGAIQANQLETHFQPIISSKTGRVTGFETLMRWKHPQKGWISPAEFIPVAESSHLIGHIGAFALQDACTQAKYWADKQKQPFEVSVNVSAAQLWHGDVEKVINDALTASGLPAHLLCIELTESVFVGDSIERIEGLLKRLKSRGIQLALDDFGTGYSSLGYLNNLPFDKLKIDRCFVSGVDISPERRRLLGGIVGLARGLDMEIVAEGVETAEELNAVLAMGCHYIQGFYYGKAQPAYRAIETAQTINANASDIDQQALRAELKLHAM